MKRSEVIHRYLSAAGQKGGQARTELKRAAGKDNCAKARAAKALYRAQPALRPVYGTQGMRPVPGSEGEPALRPPGGKLAGG